MTDNNHPITPPPELIAKWAGSMCGYYEAARWGADQELEACSQWIHGWYGNGSREVVGNLYAARRPKPPSLKEQALALLDKNKTRFAVAEEDVIRLALESLPD